MDMTVAESMMNSPSTEIRRTARLCIVDYSDKTSQEAVDLLREAGFSVSASPVSGLGQPVLTMGPHTYYGIWEIRKFVNSLPEKKPHAS